MADLFPGPDGFLLSADDPLFQSHLRLNEYLLSQEQSGVSEAPVDPAPWKRLPRHELPPLVEAVLLRFRSLREHDAELETGHLARLRLANLLRVLHKLKSSYDEPALCRLLDLTTPLLGRIEPYGPVERVREHLQQHDLTERLCAALRQFQGHLREEMSISQTSLQSLRQTLHVLLWQDEWDPMDPGRCWSECVRRDFRSMTGDRRVRWRALLKHIRGNTPRRRDPRSALAGRARRMAVDAASRMRFRASVEAACVAPRARRHLWPVFPAARDVGITDYSCPRSSSARDEVRLKPDATTK